MDVIDLNCDMGESFGAWTMGNDAEMLKIVTSANVACGEREGPAQQKGEGDRRNCFTRGRDD